jgi:DNA-binding NtrC family response regulator
MANQRLVVVVDGNTQDRVSTVTLLEGAGYQVRSARSFDEAKTLLAAERPHILVTDLRLGQYNGIHLVLRSRSEYPGMAALVTSRIADPVLEAEVHRQHAHFVLRPLTGAQLLAAVSASLNDGVAEPLAVPSDAPRVAEAPVTPDLC